jgi:transcriptional regulator with XRE-family HTH domain
MSNHNPSSEIKFNPKILGHNIVEARNRLGMKQKELADRLDISTHTLGNFESGKSDPSVRMLFSLAENLQMPPTKLLGLGEEVTIHNLNNNQQEGKVNILNSGVISSEREMFEMRIEGLREHIAAAEKTCADLREDKVALREELNMLRTQLLSTK